MPAIVLAYHSQNVNGSDYACNDHIALQRDLETVIARGLRVVTAEALVSTLRAGLEWDEPSVVFTCDDGTFLDWQDFDHPKHGMQTSFQTILLRALANGLRAPQRGVMTSFVIASALAHAAIDRCNHAGIRITHDAWWPDAAKDGTLALGCHSWDHCAVALPAAQIYSESAGNFYGVKTFAHADQQVRVAAEMIRARALDSTQATLFAYPYGQTTPYLLEQYFPTAAHGMRAAFTDSAALVNRNTSAWAIPRFVCGAHWRSPDDFSTLLDQLTP